MDTFINSEDPDEMTHYAAFHQGLYCLLVKKDLQTKTNTNTTFYKSTASTANTPPLLGAPKVIL